MLSRFRNAKEHLNRRCELRDMKIGSWEGLVEALSRDSAGLGRSPGSPDSSEGHNSLDTCPNGTSEVSIGIYATSRCR